MMAKNIAMPVFCKLFYKKNGESFGGLGNYAYLCIRKSEKANLVR